ncbi:tetratricopeptide repeat protein [Actinomadura sp. 6K520]|uniref:tetratricopeptide repeat protein n=1 Tax=Actinomadura sp. 6K520 TaxID=2530364 RepID=UPI00104DB221|nr:tetratricopeptide repeat protein [Actinomadura sp. 6K520]TDE26838.1 ATP-binding protein [Actinomadura sp. 6K520]
MSPAEVRLRPVVSWPRRAETGGRHLVSVDVELEGPLGEWPYEQEEYAIGCVLDGGSGFAVESVGDTTLVVHRFGGTYGPVTFVAQALDAPGEELCLTLVTAGGVPFRTVRLTVERPVAAAVPDEPGLDDAAEPRRRYTITPYPPPAAPLPAPYGVPPSRALAAAGERARLVGRDSELDDLHAWLRGEGARVRLVHGPGGQGKTRLAREFAMLSNTGGWEVAAAHPGEEREPPATRKPTGPGEGRRPLGLLLVVDDAEAWPVEELLDMLEDVALGGERTVRVLLLARPAGAWWRALSHRLSGRGIETDASELAPLPDDGSARRAVFLGAAELFAEVIPGADRTAISPPPELDTDPAFQRPLTIHMAALAQVSEGEGAPSRPVEVSVARQERRSWRGLHHNGIIGSTPDAMARAAYAASLVGPVPLEDCEDVLRAAGIAEPAAALRDHLYCYPPVTTGTGLQPLSPGGLAEDFVALAIPGHDHEHDRDVRAEQWAVDLLRTLAATQRGPALLGLLVEAARRWPHVAEQLNALLLERPGSAIAAGGAVLLRLTEMPEVDPEVLEAVEARLPGVRLIDLDIASAVLAERLMESRLAAVRSPAGKARLYERLSERRANIGMYEAAQDAASAALELRRAVVARALAEGEEDVRYIGALADSLVLNSGHLGRLGRHEESLGQLAEGVEVMRRLDVEHPRVFRTQLATSLNAQSLALADLGRRRESLAAVQEAVELCRAGMPSTRPALAAGLNNLSARLAEMGRCEEALAAVEEALGLYRELAEGEGDANPHLPMLAAALHNRALRLGELGRTAESARSAQEAVLIRRRLADANPGAFEAALAGSLANLAVRLGEQGRYEEGLAAGREAVDRFRPLAEMRPAAYEPDLAAALNNLSVQLGELGRSEDALAAAQEAVGVYRRLAMARSDAHRPQLAAALNNLSNRLAGVGRPDEGLATIWEAVSIRRRLAAANPAAFEADLAVSLANLADRCHDLGRYEESVSAATEAVVVFRRLAAEQPATFRPKLAACLSNLAIRLGQAERPEDGLAVSEEAVAIHRRLAAEHPEAFRPALARNLNNHSVLLAELGRTGESLSAVREAIEIQRGLAARRPRKFTAALAGSLANLSQWSLAAGLVAAAVGSGYEAVQHYRRLNSERVRSYEAELASGLSGLSATLGELERYEEAVDAAEESVQIYRRLMRRQPDALPGLARSLSGLSSHLTALGRVAEAVERGDEAVGLYRRLADERPRTFRPDLASALSNLAVALGSLGRHEDGLAAVGEAVRIHEESGDERALANARRVRDWLRTSYRGH